MKSYSHTITLMLLPVLTFAITSVISGNIALSLGLVGALSIVRFRNPVRSSFELTIYFFMITMGICASVSTKWMIVIGSVSVSIIFLSEVLNNFSKKLLNFNLFETSFNEGNFYNLLTVTSENEMEMLKNHKLLISYNYNNGLSTYTLASNRKNDLLAIQNIINLKDIKNLEYSTNS
ncbi:DUF4956 domain-containing protein [Alphaproteobacteria bacterium]|nr:DUF4956 domain-containing protein [Alphaproteobacteria bacterium]